MYQPYVRQESENRWGVYSIDGRLLMWTCSEQQARTFAQQIYTRLGTGKSA